VEVSPRLWLTDPGFDFSALGEFRDRLLAGSAEDRLLDKLLERGRALGLLKRRGQHRTKDCAAQEHVVDAAYVDAELLVHSQTARGITWRGPARPNVNWQTKVASAYTLADFTVDWVHQQVRCPQGKTRSVGLSASTSPGSPISRCACRSMTVAPVARGHAARRPSRPPGPSSPTPRPNGRRCTPHGCGRRVQRAKKPTSAARGSKAPSRRGAEPLGCTVRGTGDSRKRTCNRSPSRPQSMWSGLSPGWRGARASPHARHALRCWPLWILSPRAESICRSIESTFISTPSP
jgi:hypothetical protein